MTENIPFPNGEPNGLPFEWEEEGLDPEAEKLLNDLTVPVGKGIAKVGEVVHGDIVAEVQDRLQALRVEGYHEVDRRVIKSVPELQMTQYILDDVHYVVYRRLKQGPLNRYVSVTASLIFEEFKRMADTSVNGILLQHEQNEQAVKGLIKAGKIDDGSIYENMATKEGRFAVRSLFRLVSEDCMRPFARMLVVANRRRADELPLTFNEVAPRATHFLDMKIRQHADFDTRRLTADQRNVYNLISRDLGRAQAFAEPIAEYMDRESGHSKS